MAGGGHVIRVTLLQRSRCRDPRTAAAARYHAAASHLGALPSRHSDRREGGRCVLAAAGVMMYERTNV